MTPLPIAVTQPCARRPRRRAHALLAAWSAAALAIVAVPTGVEAQRAGWTTARAEIGDAIRSEAKPRELRAFYAARDHRPIWFRDGAAGEEAQALLRLIASARYDGLDPDDYKPRAILSALKRAGDEDADAEDFAKAETLLSRSFVALARDMRRPADMGVIYPDAELRPRVPSQRELLEQAAAAPSLSAYLERVGWMNPLYGRLRQAAAVRGGFDRDYADRDDFNRDDMDADLTPVRANLDRLRALPADLGKRFVLVDAAAARLWMYENGRVRGTMRVVVGKPSEPTPMMAALIRYASVNPYWNLPPDLVRLRVAPGAIEQGGGFLKTKRFEALSGWTQDARVVDPSTIDWQAVKDGRIDARVRQLPGPNNAMGRIKFMFPNTHGIYLHDTPEKALLREDDRLFSSGCVRLEDAPRLARWLFGKPVKITTGTPERRVDLPEPVPVYITYQTVAAEGEGIVYRPDVYGRDGMDGDGDGPTRYAGG